VFFSAWGLRWTVRDGGLPSTRKLDHEIRDRTVHHGQGTTMEHLGALQGGLRMQQRFRRGAFGGQRAAGKKGASPGGVELHDAWLFLPGCNGAGHDDACCRPPGLAPTLNVPMSSTDAKGRRVRHRFSSLRPAAAGSVGTNRGRVGPARILLVAGSSPNIGRYRWCEVAGRRLQYYARMNCRPLMVPVCCCLPTAACGWSTFAVQELRQVVFARGGWRAPRRRITLQVFLNLHA